MSNKEKQLAQSIAKAIQLLPEPRREYLMGYAEGVLATADRTKSKEEDTGQEDKSDGDAATN